MEVTAFQSFFVAASFMDLAVVRGEDGRKQLFALALNPSDPVSDQRVSVMFEFDQILRFLQYCPRQYHLRRSTYTRRTGAAVTTSWSLCRECLSNKNGLKAVVSDPEEIALFTNSWMSDHPALFNMFVKVGRLLGEDTPLPNGDPAQNGNSAASRFPVKL